MSNDCSCTTFFEQNRSHPAIVRQVNDYVYDGHSGQGASARCLNSWSCAVSAQILRCHKRLQSRRRPSTGVYVLHATAEPLIALASSKTLRLAVLVHIGRQAKVELQCKRMEIDAHWSRRLVRRSKHLHHDPVSCLSVLHVCWPRRSWAYCRYSEWRQEQCWTKCWASWTGCRSRRGM